MISRRTDRFSRTVAFITAFAIAMLTVTLVHRTIISAEEAHSDVSESYDVSDADGNEETASSETVSESILPPDTIYDPDVTEIPEDNDGIAPDNSVSEDVSDDFGMTADDGGIMTFSDDSGITPGKTEVQAIGIIIPTDSKIKIYKGDNEEITPGEIVRDGDRLSFDFKWSIDNNDKTDYSNSYFKYDLTDDLKGVTLTPKTYSYWENENVKAVYEIRNEIGSNGETRTVMLIEPREGFEEGSQNREGSVHLEGAVKLSDFPAGNTNVTLQFIKATVDVVAPSLDNSVYPRKEAVGKPVERGGKYYQQYKITLYNWTSNDTSGNTVLDVPGSVLSNPQNVYISYGNSPKTESAAAPNANGSGYIFTVGSIPSNSQACIEYEMEVDAAAALNPSINPESLKNKASVTDNTPGKPDPTTEATLDVSSIRPEVTKSGVIVKDKDTGTEKIVWTITVKSNGMGDKGFTVNDITDSNQTILGNVNWTQDDFDFIDGVWVKTYETELTEPALNNQYFHNKADVKYDGTDYVYSGETGVTYTYAAVDVNKECTGLNGDKIGWTVTVDVPDHLGSKVESIVITDTENDQMTKYNGENVWLPLLTYEPSQIKVQVEGSSKEPANTNVNITYHWQNVHQNGFVLTIDDPDFLSLVSGKKVTISYETGVHNGYDINKVIKVHNDVSCTVNYENDPLSGNDSAEYINEPKLDPFVINKYTTNATWYDPEGNINEPAKLRELTIWSVTLSNFTNLDTKKDNIITFTDKLPEGYTYDTTLKGTQNPKYYISGEISNPYMSFRPDVKFNSDYTEITGTITLTGDQAKAIMANNGSINIKYYTQMTEAKYRDYLIKGVTEEGATETFTNTVSATVNTDTREADCSVDKKPGNKVLNKTSSKEFSSGQDVKYTIAVNSEAIHLGDNTADFITLTDTLGKYLKFNENSLTITPNTGVEWSYDSDKREVTFKLKNDTAYTIEYNATVITSLTKSDYDLTDGIDDARDSAVIDELYGNTAKLAFPGGNDIVSNELIGANIYRSSVYIQSVLFGTNDNDKDVMYLRLKKKWDDKDNRKADLNGKVYHDETVSVILAKYMGDTQIKTEKHDIVHLNNPSGTNNDDDYYKIIKLPLKDKSGNFYTYKIVGEEGLPENYTLTPSAMTAATGKDVVMKDDGTALTTYVITATNTYSDNNEKTKITVKKAWNGENGNTQNRGTSVGFTITQDGKPYKSGTLNAKSGWEQSFDLPKYSDDANPKEHVYGVIETTTNPYYKPTYTSVKDPDGKGTKLTITNNYLDQTEIKVTKEWKNDDDYTHLRNGSVSIVVKQDGANFKTVKLSNENEWTQTIKVPKYSDINKTKLYTYSVSEVDTGNPYYEKPVITPKQAAGGGSFTITNTFKPRKVTKIKVKKVWAKDKGYEYLRSDWVDISVLSGGRDYQFGELSEDDDWEYTFSELPKLNTYDVVEHTNNPNYDTSVSPPSAEPDGTLLYTVTNTFKPINITITKIWDDKDNEDKRPDSVKVILKQNGKQYGGIRLLKGSKDDDRWSLDPISVPKYDKSGAPYIYTVEEEPVTGYTLKVAPPNEGNGYKATLTNTYSADPTDPKNEEISLTVIKQWLDKGYEDKRANVDAVEFDLIRNKGKADETVTHHEIPKKEGDIWECTIEPLLKYDENNAPYTYTVKETGVINGYTSTVTQDPTEKNGNIAVIENKYNAPQTINISVTKNWDDDGYRFKRGDVTLMLINSDGETVDERLLLAKDNIKKDAWTCIFRGVPKYDNDGNEYTYTIDEEAPDGYTLKVIQAPTEGNGYKAVICNEYDVPADPNDPNDPSDPSNPSDPDNPNDPDNPDPGGDTPPDTPNPPPVTGSNPGTKPSYPPPGTNSVSPVYTTVTEPKVTEPKEPGPHEEPEDVSAEAGFFDEEFDPVRRDDMMILILAGIIVTGTLILAFRHRSDKSDGKYHM